MSESRSISTGRGRRLLLAALAVCTGWLIVQNLILLILLPSGGLPRLADAGRLLARGAWFGPLLLAALPLAFGLGCVVAGRRGQAGVRRSS